ncbi:MAG: sulfite exporter TauE/SafE family protein, partial [Dehalococcoidia bacterium]
MTPVDALLVALLAGGAAFMQALTGFGFSLLIVPPLALVIGPKEAVVVANVLSGTVNLVMVSRLHAKADWRVAGRLLVGAMAGMPFGLAVLIVISPRGLQVVIAVMVLVFTWMLARGLRLHAPGG